MKQITLFNDLSEAGQPQPQSMAQGGNAEPESSWIALDLPDANIRYLTDFLSRQRPTNAWQR